MTRLRPRHEARHLAAIVAIVAFVEPQIASAQSSNTLPGVTYEWFAPARDVRDPHRQFSISVLRLSATYPIFLSKSTILLPGFTYERVNIDARGGEDATPEVMQLPAAKFDALHIFSESISAYASIAVGFASDFEESLSRHDIMLSLIGLVSYKVNRKLSLGAGALYDARSGTVVPVPTIGVNWEFAERARLTGVVPAQLSLEFRPVRWLLPGLRATFQGNRYHVAGSRYGVEDLEIAYSVVTVGPKITFNFTKSLHLDIYAAAAVWRRYEIFVDDVSVRNVQLAPSVGFGARIWAGPLGWSDD